MSLAALAFAAGVVLLQQQAALPSLAWAWALIPLAALALRFRVTCALLALSMGFMWAAVCAHSRMADWLAPELEGRDLEVVGVVAGLPALLERGVRFEFDVESVAGAERLPRKLLLSWYRSPFQEEQAAILAGAVHPGERWLFTLRLRRPHGNVNPHGFDYEAWLLERGIGATGYVRARGTQRLLGFRAGVADLIERSREVIRHRILGSLAPTPAAGI